MIYGAILAGGVGKRIKRYSIPKQFITVGGIPIIIITLREFIKNNRFDLIYISVHSDWSEYLERLLKDNFSIAERRKIIIVKGGKQRLDSFNNIVDDIINKHGLNNDDILICHDSVRPFVRQQMINDCIDATNKDGLALTVIPTTDTIHIAHNEKFIDGALERDGLYNGQTPSGFNIALLKRAIDNFSEKEKSRVTGTTQLMLKLGYKIRIVKGHPSNFKITTDNDLDIADRILRSEQKKRTVSILDCTLRDGGIVVDFNFGIERTKKILSCLQTAGVEYIECGYIDEKKGSSDGRTCFASEQLIKKYLINKDQRSKAIYVAMIDYGTFNVKNLHFRDHEGIDGIRLAFHKEQWTEAVECGEIILNKGYDLYIQPMVSLRYSDDEYCELIQVCNEKLSGAKGFYIVDSFGQMDNMSLMHKLKIADMYVAPDMKIGFHAHNNRQLAYSNALAFLNYNTKHDIILDSSIMGMGKGAGNLCTELIAESLIKEGKCYQIGCLYESISEYFSKVIKEHPWGYSLVYYLSSLYSCTPSYINIFLKDNRVTMDNLIELIKTIPEEKKVACDHKFASDHLAKYFFRNNVFTLEDDNEGI